MAKKDRLYRVKMLAEITMEFTVPSDTTVKRSFNAEFGKLQEDLPEHVKLVPQKTWAPKKVIDLEENTQALAYPRIWTDGGCYPNPGPGGWGVYMEMGSKAIRSCGTGGQKTTNNRMELQAAIEGLKLIPEDTYAVLYTDSKYVKNGITDWINGWKMRGWVTYSGSPVKNKDLWEELEALNKKRKVQWEWVKGHQGNKGNEEADDLATQGKNGFTQYQETEL